MVEKLGHKKMIQSARMDWINEGKPRSVNEDTLFDDPELPPRHDTGREKTASRIAPIFETAESERPKTPLPNREPDFDDLYYATPKVVRQKPATQSTSVVDGNGSIFGPGKFASADDGPPDDDLEALLADAEQEGGNNDDDFEALLAAENDMNLGSEPAKQSLEKSAQAEADAMEAMMDMEMEMDMNGW